MRLGAVAHTCNPSTLGGRGGWITRWRDRDHPGQQGETPSLLKIQKISWAWWRVPVIPATQEAEAGELLEPRRRRLRWAKIAPLHSSLGNKNKTPSQKQQQQQKTTESYEINTILLFISLSIFSECYFDFQFYLYYSELWFRHMLPSEPFLYLVLLLKKKIHILGKWRM